MTPLGNLLYTPTLEHDNKENEIEDSKTKLRDNQDRYGRGIGNTWKRGRHPNIRDAIPIGSQPDSTPLGNLVHTP